MDSSTFPTYTGALLLAANFQSFVFGIIIVQSYSYFSFYRDDPLYLRIMVWAFMILNLLSCICDIISVWDLFVVNFGLYIADFVLPLPNTVSTFTRIVITAMAQSFFAARTYHVSKSIVVAGVIGALIVLGFGSSMAFAIMIAQEAYLTAAGLSRIGVAAQISYWSAAVCDVSISAFFIYILSKKSKGQKGFSASTDHIVSRLLGMAIGTASVTTVLALVLVIMFEINSTTTRAWSVPAVVLPRVYTASVLFVLNARQKLRLAAEASDSHSLPRTTANGRTTKRGNGNGNAGMTSGIAVHLDTFVTHDQAPTEKGTGPIGSTARFEDQA